MATTIKLIRETKLDCEKYFIYKDDWCEHVVSIYNNDPQELKESRITD